MPTATANRSPTADERLLELLLTTTLTEYEARRELGLGGTEPRDLGPDQVHGTTRPGRVPGPFCFQGGLAHGA